MQSVEGHSSNGHIFASEGSDLSSVEQSEEGKTAKSFKSDIVTAEELLKILSSDWLESHVLKQFVQIQQSSKPSFLKSSDQEGSSVGGAGSGISILLLDAENLKLNIYTETFLARLCKYPLQVKIAFANWRNPAIGKQDAELYERGYQLVHVPGGKNSADAKMIALGSSILQQYQKVKEVFVCSDDGILTHLCNQLQNQGLFVYWVRRQNHILKVENRNTGEVSDYSLAMEMEIPKSEDFLQKIKQLIETEQESITERLNKLTTVANLFQERCNLALNPNPSNSVLPIQAESPSTGSLRSELSKTDEIIHVVKAESTQSLARKERESSESTLAKISINSFEVLEEVIVAITSKMATESKRDYVSVTKLKSQFQTQYKETADSMVKKLQPDCSLIKFIKSRPILFDLALVGKEHEVKVLVSKSLPYLGR